MFGRELCTYQEANVKRLAPATTRDHDAQLVSLGIPPVLDKDLAALFRLPPAKTKHAQTAEYHVAKVRAVAASAELESAKNQLAVHEKCLCSLQGLYQESEGKDE